MVTNRALGKIARNRAITWFTALTFLSDGFAWSAQIRLGLLLLLALQKYLEVLDEDLDEAIATLVF
jgi:hypothetical protein